MFVLSHVNFRKSVLNHVNFKSVFFKKAYGTHFLRSHPLGTKNKTNEWTSLKLWGIFEKFGFLMTGLQFSISPMPPPPKSPFEFENPCKIFCS